MTTDTAIPCNAVDHHASSLTNAFHLAWVAKAIYNRHIKAAWPLFEATYPQAIPFEKGRVFGIVGAVGEDVVIAFRGSDENREWIGALECGQVPWETGRVHEGLAEALDGVWQEVMAALYDTGALDKRIWLTGHSLGGALATLAAYRLSLAGIEPHFVATFGAPRVMGPVAAAAFTPPTYRFVNNEDVIPDFPWPTLLSEYVHVGERVFLLPSGGIAEARHDEHLARRLDRANGIGAPLPLGGIARDHLIVNYLAKLEGLAETSEA